ncbi:YceD family protein [Roseisalinus antarcticus]|uniref:DUF177 domain-containing protein n=1 Tax=Roseisalinus antarcticus TaxID=254357 RepID=A0A1Y5RN85_9RHOB|nr:DUF177 domain-containing protein [Roseisalinus antarcticus]SLN18862.1 hypothetical protein ROA7023_00418 [Roseisalinus antarcticus]
MTSPLPSEVLRLADLPTRKVTHVVLEPDGPARKAIAEALGIPAVRKFRFDARLEPLGRTDWQLTGTLGATVVQDCVVTLEPVTTRIDETLARRYLADFELPEDGSETEMPEDDQADPLPATLDLYAVGVEALSLALPPYPRAEGAGPGDALFAEPGVDPLTDDAVKPFAGLAALRDQLSSGQEPVDDDDDSGTDEVPEK